MSVGVIEAKDGRAARAHHLGRLWVADKHGATVGAVPVVFIGLHRHKTIVLRQHVCELNHTVRLRCVLRRVCSRLSYIPSVTSASRSSRVDTVSHNLPSTDAPMLGHGWLVWPSIILIRTYPDKQSLQKRCPHCPLPVKNLPSVCA